MHQQGLLRQEERPHADAFDLPLCTATVCDGRAPTKQKNGGLLSISDGGPRLLLIREWIDGMAESSLGGRRLYVMPDTLRLLVALAGGAEQERMQREGPETPENPIFTTEGGRLLRSSGGATNPPSFAGDRTTDLYR